MIFHFNPKNPRATRAVISLNGQPMRGVVFADDERGLVYTLREIVPPCDNSGNASAVSRFQMLRFRRNETTGDFPLEAHEGDVKIELPEMPGLVMNGLNHPGYRS